MTVQRRTIEVALNAVGSALGDNHALKAISSSPDTYDTQQLVDLLGNMLISNILPNAHGIFDAVDSVYTEINRGTDAKSQLVSIESAERNGSAIHVGKVRVITWRGDITKLQGAGLAIVNAANDQGMGCFQPQHRCLDNVIHRAAGPRLRDECAVRMSERSPPHNMLVAGSPPIVTGAYHIPATKILHITGPQIRQGQSVSHLDEARLRACYLHCLDVAARDPKIRTLVFPCISTGLFGYPQEEAAWVAADSVRKWLEENDSHPNLDLIIFNTFTDQDEAIYTHFAPMMFQSETPLQQAPGSSADVAAKWIRDADAVLVCAGAGMSVNEGQSVYVNEQDFANAYPEFFAKYGKYGYTTAYACMGLSRDSRVPPEARSAQFARHADNMTRAFKPNEGYHALRSIIGSKEYFVYTSNIDAAFARAGFENERIYTPQGEFTRFQCMSDGSGPCRPDAVFDSRPFIDQVLEKTVDGVEVDLKYTAKCKHCGSRMFPNVRGGQWFTHTPYDAQQDRFIRWVDALVGQGKRIVILEVGVGFNTPIVTRVPMESIAFQHKEITRFIRINPTAPETPSVLGTRSFGVRQGAVSFLTAVLTSMGKIVDEDDAEIHADTTGDRQVAAMQWALNKGKKQDAASFEYMQRCPWKVTVQRLKR